MLLGAVSQSTANSSTCLLAARLLPTRLQSWGSSASALLVCWTVLLLIQLIKGWRAFFCLQDRHRVAVVAG